MSVLGVIPARYGSTRFPGKMLARVSGKPLIELVWRRAREAKRLNRLLVATDDKRILDLIQRLGGEAVMTDPGLPSGTDRVWQAAKGTDAQIIVNIQGDEPLLTAGMVNRLVEVFTKEPEVQMATLKYPMKDSQGFDNPNLVKVVTDSDGWALYFSRSPIPYYRLKGQTPARWDKHLGLYAYRRRLLEQFVQWPASALEKAEQLEQLRALEHGVRIKVLDSPKDTVGVDTPQDLERVERILAEC